MLRIAHRRCSIYTEGKVAELVCMFNRRRPEFHLGKQDGVDGDGLGSKQGFRAISRLPRNNRDPGQGSTGRYSKPWRKKR